MFRICWDSFSISRKKVFFPSLFSRKKKWLKSEIISELERTKNFRPGTERIFLFENMTNISTISPYPERQKGSLWKRVNSQCWASLAAEKSLQVSLFVFQGTTRSKPFSLKTSAISDFDITNTITITITITMNMNIIVTRMMITNTMRCNLSTQSDLSVGRLPLFVFPSTRIADLYL